MEFKDALELFVKGGQIILDGFFRGRPAEGCHKLIVREGNKYLKVVDQVNGEDQSAWAFIDKETGDVLRPDSWKQPSKLPRGNIFDEANGLANCSFCGPRALK